MAILRIMYKMEQMSSGVVDSITFDNKSADLDEDHSKENPLIFESKTPYILTTIESTVLLEVLAHSSNNQLYNWKMFIWLVDKQGKKTIDLTPVPIKKRIDASGHADRNITLTWKI